MHEIIILAFSVVLISIIIYLIIKYFFNGSEQKEGYKNVYNTANDFILSKLKKDVSLIDPRFSDIDLKVGKESFTLNKKEIFLCINPKKEKGYYNYNMLLHVLLHELAHYISSTHDPSHKSKEFNDNFQMLLTRAKELQIYDDAEEIIEDYCL